MRFSLLINSGLLLISGLSLNACDHVSDTERVDTQKTARPVKLLTVQASGIRTIRSYPGILDASKKAELAFRVGGQLVELPGQPGMQVKKGEVIARLDNSKYKNILDEKEAKYELAKIQNDQARKLVNQKVGSQLKYDLASAELKMAKSAMEVARDNLNYTRLLAPFDGVIAQLSVDNYQAIQPQEPIIHFQDEESLDVYISVPESMITQLISPYDPDSIQKFCGYVQFVSHRDKRFKACYKKHDSIPDPLTRNYLAVFTLLQITDFVTLPGMTVTMTLDFSPFINKSMNNSILVPVEAVFDQDGKQWVWVVNNKMKTKQTEVKTNRFIENSIIITKGLSSGQVIITAGVSYIRENMLVRPVIKERGL